MCTERRTVGLLKCRHWSCSVGDRDVRWSAHRPSLRFDAFRLSHVTRHNVRPPQGVQYMVCSVLERSQVQSSSVPFNRLVVSPTLPSTARPLKKKTSHPAPNQQLLPTCRHELDTLHRIHPRPPTPGRASQAHRGAGSTPNTQLFAMPYSEHSSFYELTCFVLPVDWTRIVATVNVESAKSRAGDDNVSWASSSLHRIVHWSIGD
jgi:hypothetical protein